MYSKTSIPEITIDNVLYALDSTTISTSIKLAAWALGKQLRNQRIGSGMPVQAPMGH